jgi:hypothetical protein
MATDNTAYAAAAAEQGVNEEGKEAGSPLGDSTKVAWVLKDEKGHVRDGFAWYLNPQAIIRTPTNRNQLFGTKSGFYVDDFGPGSTSITIEQYVASSKRLIEGKPATLSSEVKLFLESIYGPAVEPDTNLQLWFYDNHMEQGGVGGGELVYFPANGLSLRRSVSMANVWALTFTMQTLTRNPYPGIPVGGRNVPDQKTIVFIVKTDNTLHQLVYFLAGSKRTEAKIRAITAEVLRLNPQIQKFRQEQIFNAKEEQIGERAAKPGQIIAGEKLLLPAAP